MSWIIKHKITGEQVGKTYKTFAHAYAAKRRIKSIQNVLYNYVTTEIPETRRKTL